jgi:hypothetical protein
MRYAIIIIGLLSTPGAFAKGERCESVIALSKTKGTVVVKQHEVQSHAENFCKEYSKGSASGSSASFGASYKFLSLSFGNANASQEEVASRYCSGSKKDSAVENVYEQYIEAIAPGAYSSYDQCMKLANYSNLQFAVDPESVTPKEFNVFVFFASDFKNDKKAEVIYTATLGVNCQWVGVTDSKDDAPRIFKTGSSGLLKCTRENQGVMSSVTLLRTDSAKSDERLSIPWQEYTEEGIPVNRVKSLESTIQTLQSEFTALNSTLTTRLDKLNGRVTEIEKPKIHYTYGNNGTVSCNEFCLNRTPPHNWHPYTGECLAAEILGNGGVISCGYAPNKPVECLCTISPFKITRNKPR